LPENNYHPKLMNWTEKILSLFRSDSGPEICGPLSLRGNLHFPKGGKFEANLAGKISSRQTLLIGPQAEITGDLRVEHCQIQGKCEGRIDASGSVRIDATGGYSGKLAARSLRVEPGAEFQSELAIEPNPVFEETPGESILLFAENQQLTPSTSSAPSP
jgi:cytoskeletal protein CcmA (bactofilin family)